MRDISLLLNLRWRRILLLKVNLGVLLDIVLAQELLIREELRTVFALHGLCMVTLFWNLDEIFICGQCLLFYLVFLLEVAQLSIIFLNSISNFFG